MDNVDKAQADIEALTPDEYEIFRQWLFSTHDPARRAAPVVEAAQSQIIDDLREQGVIDEPVRDAEKPEGFTPWRDPGVSHARMHREGDRVLHGGRVWESMHPGLNHWEPGAPGIDQRIWLDITEQLFPVGEKTEEEEGVEPDGVSYVRAWGPGQDYKPDDQVLFAGQVYEVVQAHVSASHWPPDQVASLYKLHA